VLHSRLKLGRAIVLAGLIGLSLTACGRKGPLEPPPMASNAVDLPDRDTGAEELTPPNPSDASPLGKPPRTNRNFTIPEKSFVLDPLL
jgi:predicted small lipoprotein YifL